MSKMLDEMFKRLPKRRLAKEPSRGSLAEKRKLFPPAILDPRVSEALRGLPEQYRRFYWWRWPYQSLKKEKQA